MYRPEVKINAVLSVCLKRGHRHCFDLTDPKAAEVRHYLTDPAVELVTTHDDGAGPVYVRVVDVDETDLKAVLPNGQLIVLH